MNICLKSSLMALSLLILQPLYSQPDFSTLDKKLEENKKLLGNHFAVMIWKMNDTLVYKKEFGDMKTRTVAPIASCSKWLTAAVILQLVDEGKLSLDENVVTYIPEFEKYRKNYITIRHCLSHMTGIEDEGGLIKKLFQRKKFSSLEEEVNAFAAREIRANAGTDFWYGNIGLNIAARVAEVVSRKKFDLLIRQKLFTPLGMRNTSFSSLDGSLINPSGGARSTAEDYMRFLVMLMNNGSYKGKQVLSEESVNELKRIHSASVNIRYAPQSADGFNYALGSWVLEEGNDGFAKTLSSPGLFGTWPMVNFCKGYAYILFVKSLLGEERADVQMEIKKLIDDQFSDECKQ